MKTKDIVPNYPVQVNAVAKAGRAGYSKAFINQLLYRSSHALCVPLKTISGLLNLIEQSGDSARSGQYIDLISVSLQNMQALLEEVDQLVNNEGRKVTISPVNFADLMKEMMPVLEDSIRDNEIELTTTIVQGTDFFTDRIRIQSALFHLLSNAITFRDESKENLFIDVSITANDGSCVIAVEDNGLGMSEFIQSKMFQPFFRASERSKGAGLGLFVVNSLVDKLGGTIKVTSQPTQGSTFTVSVPNSMQ